MESLEIHLRVGSVGKSLQEEAVAFENAVDTDTVDRDS